MAALSRHLQKREEHDNRDQMLESVYSKISKYLNVIAWSINTGGHVLDTTRQQ